MFLVILGCLPDLVPGVVPDLLLDFAAPSRSLRSGVAGGLGGTFGDGFGRLPKMILYEFQWFLLNLGFLPDLDFELLLDFGASSRKLTF